MLRSKPRSSSCQSCVSIWSPVDRRSPQPTPDVQSPSCVTSRYSIPARCRWCRPPLLRHYCIRSERAILSRRERSRSREEAVAVRSAVESLPPDRGLQVPRSTASTRVRPQLPSSNNCWVLRHTGWRMTAARSRPWSRNEPPTSRGTGRSPAVRSWTASSSLGRWRFSAAVDEAVQTTRRTTRWPYWTETGNWTAVATRWRHEQSRSASSSSSTWRVGSGTRPTNTRNSFTLRHSRKKKILHRQLRSVARELNPFTTLWAGEGWPPLSLHTIYVGR